ncbi:acylglycerol kinase family protein [Candidatus Saccharibacteria bacterium]|nr:acylglycerol kinase family protein [Candidatus Saccharibacteria bacterium]
MKRLLIVYNPRSSRFDDVKREVFPKTRQLKGYVTGKYEIKPTNIEQNITELAKIVQDGDLIISAGGDATGVISANAIIKSRKDATLAVLPYGNFNDLARTLGTMRLEDVFGEKASEGLPEGSFGGCCQTAVGAEQTKSLLFVSRRRPADDPKGRERKSASPVKTGASDSVPEGSPSMLFPLKIIVDGKFFRYATCYVTIGMTAEAVKLYDSKKMRRKLKHSFGRKIISYTAIASWYFKNRHKHQFIPSFTLNKHPESAKTSDYFAINGRSIAHVMRGGEDYLSPKTFRSETYRLTGFFRLAKMMLRSMFHRIPSSETAGDILEFSAPATVTIQAEGESQQFTNIHKIEIKKTTKYLKVITLN